MDERLVLGIETKTFVFQGKISDNTEKRKRCCVARRGGCSVVEDFL